MAIIAKLYNHPASADYKNIIYGKSYRTKASFLGLGTLMNTLECNRPIQNGTLDIPRNLGNFQNSNANMISYTVEGGREEIYFVMGAEWVNNNTTRLRLKKHVFYTYLGEWEIRSSNQLRGHPQIWAYGDPIPIWNTTPEPIAPSGEWIIRKQEVITENINWACVVVSPTQGLEISGSASINNPFVFYVPIAEKTFDFTFFNGSLQLSTSGSLRGHPYVQSIYAVPFVPFTYTFQSTGSNQIQLNVSGGTNTTITYAPEGEGTEERAPAINCIFAENIFSKTLKTIDLSSTWSTEIPINTPANWARYDPKLFTSQFRKFRLVSPGGECDIALENLENYKQITFKGYAAYGATPTVKYEVVGYKGIGGSLSCLIDDNEDRSLPIVNNAWNDYVANNANSMNFTMLQRLLSGISGLAGGPTQLANTLKAQSISGLGDLSRWADINSKPNSISNTSTSGTFESYFKSGGNVYFQCIGYPDREYERIAAFLHRFGYNMGGSRDLYFIQRQDFDYVQAENVAVVGIQNEDDEEEFKQIFLNGTTMWHRPNPNDSNKWYSDRGPNQ